MRRARGPVWCPENLIGTPLQIIKIPRGGPPSENKGPTGKKLKPARVWARVMAELGRTYKGRKIGTSKKKN